MPPAALVPGQSVSAFKRPSETRSIELRQSHDLSGDVRAAIGSLDKTLSALLASGKPAEAILSEMMSEVTRAFPRQREPARDLILEFLLEKAVTNQESGSAPLGRGNVIGFLEERNRRTSR
jgi:hypothetical protein